MESDINKSIFDFEIFIGEYDVVCCNITWSRGELLH